MAVLRNYDVGKNLKKFLLFRFLYLFIFLDFVAVIDTYVKGSLNLFYAILFTGNTCAPFFEILTPFF